MVLGLALLATGAWMAWGPRIPFLGKLPGDIVIRKGSLIFYVPIATCIVISIALTLLMRCVGRK